MTRSVIAFFLCACLNFGNTALAQSPHISRAAIDPNVSDTVVKILIPEDAITGTVPAIFLMGNESAVSSAANSLEREPKRQLHAMLAECPIICLFGEAQLDLDEVPKMYSGKFGMGANFNAGVSAVLQVIDVGVTAGLKTKLTGISPKGLYSHWGLMTRVGVPVPFNDGSLVRYFIGGTRYREFKFGGSHADYQLISIGRNDSDDTVIEIGLKRAVGQTALKGSDLFIKIGGRKF